MRRILLIQCKFSEFLILCTLVPSVKTLSFHHIQAAPSVIDTEGNSFLARVIGSFVQYSADRGGYRGHIGAPRAVRGLFMGI